MNPVAAATGLAPSALALAAGMTFVAAGIRGLTGFGMAIVLVPLLGIIMRPDDAVVLAILLQFIIGPVGIRTILVEADRKSALPIAGLAMLATPGGLWVLARTSPDMARLAIAAIAIGAFLLVLATFRASRRPGGIATVAAGIAAGVLTGFAAMPGPPVVPYYLRSAFSAYEARGSMMLIFFAIAGTVCAAAMGLGTPALAMLAAVLTIPMLAGNALGARAFGSVPDRVWRGAVALLLGIAGVFAVVRIIG